MSPIIPGSIFFLSKTTKYKQTARTKIVMKDKFNESHYDIA